MELIAALVVPLAMGVVASGLYVTLHIAKKITSVGSGEDHEASLNHYQEY